MSVRILIGDVREQLRVLPDNHFDCVITSPPYWGLRDYGVTGQLGMEPSLGEHVRVMVEVFREVRRVLKPTGTLWLNYGDSYAASPNGRSAADTKATGNDDRTFRDKPFSTVGPIGGIAVWDRKSERNGHNFGADDNTVPNHRIVPGGVLKPKDLCGIPWRVALALQEDGWWLRQDIIWSKPNPMPESVTDRCTKAHEYIFLMSKASRYHFDAEAIAEPVAASSLERWAQDIESQAGSDRVPGKTNGTMKAVGRAKVIGRGIHGSSQARGNDRSNSGGYPNETGTRNKRSVWEVTTQPFSEAHFATFPPALIEPCILAGCPESGHVLDPFGGAGTTGLVADRLRRHCTLIELNPEYAAIADRRIRGDAGMFAEVATT